MLRKVLPAAAAAALVALAFAMPADATAARVKGKFKPNAGMTEKESILGSAKVRPMPDGTQRVGITLQHVRRADYQVWVGSYNDANGNEVAEPAEQLGYVRVTCTEDQLSKPSGKGHAGCVGYASMPGTPYVVELRVPGSTASDGSAYLKR